MKEPGKQTHIHSKVSRCLKYNACICVYREKEIADVEVENCLKRVREAKGGTATGVQTPQCEKMKIKHDAEELTNAKIGIG